jgi:hypothetical protein
MYQPFPLNAVLASNSTSGGNIPNGHDLSELLIAIRCAKLVCNSAVDETDSQSFETSEYLIS